MDPPVKKMTYSTDYGLDELYRSMSVTDDQEKGKSFMIDELYRASPVAQKVNLITQPTYRLPKPQPGVLSLKAQLFNQLKMKDGTEAVPLHPKAIKKSHSLNKSRTNDHQYKTCEISQPKDTDPCETNQEKFSVNFEDNGDATKSKDVQRSEENLCMSKSVKHLNKSISGIISNNDADKIGTNGDNSDENVELTDNGNTVSLEKLERTTKEPVKNLMADFLFSSASPLRMDKPRGTENGQRSVTQEKNSVKSQDAVTLNQPKTIKKHERKNEKTDTIRETKEIKEYKLRKWIVHLSSSGGVIVEGHRQGDDPDQMWHSSSIVKRISNRRVSTAGGSIYILVGPIDKHEAKEQNVSHSLVKVFKNGFPVSWKEILQQENEARLKKTLIQTEMPKESFQLRDETNCQLKPNPDITSDSLDNKFNEQDKNYITPQQLKKSLINDHSKSFESPHQPKPEKPSILCNSIKKTEKPEEIGGGKTKASFLHYKPGDVVALDELPKTRSGRKIVPQLSWWTGQRLFTDSNTTTTVMGPFSPGVSDLDVTVQVSLRQDRSIQRAQKRVTQSKNSKRKGKVKDGFNSDRTTSTIESDIHSLPDSSFVESEVGEDEVEQKLSLKEAASLHCNSRGTKSFGSKKKTKETSNIQKDNVGESLKTGKKDVVLGHMSEKVQENNVRTCSSVRKTRSMTSLRNKLKKTDKENTTGLKGEKKSTKKSNLKVVIDSKKKSNGQSVESRRSANGRLLNICENTGIKKDPACTKVDILSESLPVLKTGKKQRSSFGKKKAIQNLPQKQHNHKMVKDDVLLNSSLFVDEDIPQNTIVFEDDFLSGDSSQLEVRSDIIGMLEARRKVRLVNKPNRQTCYNSPRIGLNNIVQTKSHSEKYFLKKALLHNVTDDVRETVAKNSPVVELLNVEEKNKPKGLSKKNSKQDTKPINKLAKKSVSVVDDAVKRNNISAKSAKTSRRKSLVSVQDKKKTIPSTSKTLTVIEPSQHLVCQPEKTTWTKWEITKLRRAMFEVSDCAPNYWKLVANALQTRTAEECYTYHYSSMAANNSDKKKKPKKPQGKPAAVLTGHVGTLKRKRALRDIMEHHNQNNDMDLFDSTPYRKNKKPKLDLTGSNDCFSPMGDLFRTPAVKGSNYCVNPSKTPLPSFVSPGIIKNANRNGTDVYLNRVKKAKHVLQKSKNALPATMSQAKSRPLPASKLNALNMNSDWFKVQDQIDEGSEEDDLYFSDDTSV